MSDLAKMNALLNKLSDAKFQYGKTDCYIFTAKLVEAWHGKSYFMHTVYKNQKEADAYMAKFGGIEALTTGTLGYSIEPTLCADGDVVTAEIASGQIALGFVHGGHGLFKMRKTVIKVPLRKCRMGWSIK